MVASPLSPFILIKGAGEMASAVAWRLHRANMVRICMLDLENPLAVRRQVSFCTALETGAATVEGVAAVAAGDRAAIESAWNRRRIAVVAVADWAGIEGLVPDIVIDAILAKRNLGTTRDEAGLVIGLGPGFAAGRDVHQVIETNRGHDLGRIISSGAAAANTGVPGAIAGHGRERVVRAPAAGMFRSDCRIGDHVDKGAMVGYVDDRPVEAGLAGILRGLIRPGTEVRAGMKLGDIDARGKKEYCATISDKARAISGSALEAVMRHVNRTGPTA